MSSHVLPMHKRSPTVSKYYRFNSIIRPRPYTVLKFLIPAVVVLFLLGFYHYEPHVEFAFYERDWVHKEIDPVKPLAGCFDSGRVSPRYNVSEAVYGPKFTNPQAGMQMRFGMDCYDFAGTIKSPSKSGLSSIVVSAEQRTQFHTYWRIDLAEFGPRQEYMLKSFFATQDLSSTRLVLWSNGDLAERNLILQKYLKRYPDAFTVRKLSIRELARGTVLEGSSLLASTDKKAWLDGDLIRLLLLWNYGGVWVDMDSLLTRDLEPLLEHEFVTQWDCYDKKYSALNGALMHFRQHSPYLCEAFHIMLNDSPPRSGSTDWGSVLYFKLWRRLVAASIPPFKILPFCFTDGRSCRLDNRLPDPFVSDDSKGKWTMGLGMEEGGALDKTLHEKVFGVHLHNQWNKEFPRNGWVERLLLKKYDRKMETHHRT
ncbi:glycosyltransferase family 32 protein [Dendrothele bispora CBS 962.96]|uniref:Glycosyltransferase family 32 protein n=1 Tax=Dendrothele bispora (strain CBS 962.96) TaxID=1314807 RepID=A0A4S8L1K4_DENBC|nr:glycosyltransferase family 32 protein [Dendrothele bispora CBS 962.96]